MVMEWTETFIVWLINSRCANGRLSSRSYYLQSRIFLTAQDQTRVRQHEHKEHEDRYPLHDCLQCQFQCRLETSVQGVRCVAPGKLDARVVNM